MITVKYCIVPLLVTVAYSGGSFLPTLLCFFLSFDVGSFFLTVGPMYCEVLMSMTRIP